jgi:hypothetical protein
MPRRESVWISAAQFDRLQATAWRTNCTIGSLADLAIRCLLAGEETTLALEAWHSAGSPRRYKYRDAAKCHVTTKKESR